MGERANISGTAKGENPARPHNLKGLVGLGQSASEIIRTTSICNPNASDTKLDEATPNPKLTEKEVGSQESEKEVIDLGHRKGNKDQEELALQMGLIAAKQHSHKLVEALQAQAGQPDADGSGRKTGPQRWCMDRKQRGQRALP